jgi:hypothetical protein
MPSVTEAAAVGSQLEAALEAGLRSIDRNQQVTFTQYQSVVLPADGYLFWVSTGQTIEVEGSLHYAVDVRQAEDETIAVNRIQFTCEEEIQEFNSIAPNILWIGALGDQAASNSEQAPGLAGLTPSPVLFAFSSRDKYFRKANVFHYFGVAVQPALLAQLIDSAADLPAEPIVGDSLPIWLGLTKYGPVYPSFLVPANVEPPYVVAHIPPESTEPLQAFATFDPGPLVDEVGAVNMGAVDTMPVNAGQFGAPGAAPLQWLPSSQLLRERVRLTLYGFNNQTAIQYLQYLFDYSLNTDAFGVMNMPAIRDEKRVQADIMALAQKKTIDLEISYYQATAMAVALRLIAAVATDLVAEPAPESYVLTTVCQGPFSSGQQFPLVPTPSGIALPSTITGPASATAGTAPLGPVTLYLVQNLAAFIGNPGPANALAEITFAAGATSGVVMWLVSRYDVPVGTTLYLVMPAPADPILADLTISFAGDAT